MAEKELTDEQYDAIIECIEKGDAEDLNDNFKTAITFYEKGLSLVPNPKYDWEISTHLYVALGDAYLNLREFEMANNFYNQALKCPDALSNAYIYLGLGQSYYELENMEQAKNTLISAYMLAGKEIFEDEDDKYFSFLKQNVKLE
ncbi:MAG: hypothetical protein KGV59_07795 [Tenacibaculum sp.]|nr:hypothetical protein [Tenacibaculum sp.]